MIYLDLTFFIQLVVFLLLLLVLTPVFFKPMMAMYERREKQVAEPKAQAETIGAEADDIRSGYKDKMAATLQKAEEIKSGKLKEAADEEKTILSTAREQNAEQLATMRKELADARAEAIGKLNQQADEFGQQIANTILGSQS